MISEIDIRKAFYKCDYNGSVLFPEDDIFWERYVTLLDDSYNIRSKYDIFKKHILLNYTNIDSFYKDVEKYYNFFYAKCTNDISLLQKLNSINNNYKLYNLMEKGNTLEVGKTYLSIDLKEAFNNLLFHHDNLQRDEWIDFYFSQLNIPKFIYDLKGLRSLIYNDIEYRTNIQNNNIDNFSFKKIFRKGVLENVEKVLNGDDEIMELIRSKNLEICNLLLDELLFDISDCIEVFLPFVKENDRINGVDVHIKIFTQKALRYTYNNSKIMQHSYRVFSDGKLHFLRRHNEFIYQIIDELCGNKPFDYEPIVRIGGKPTIIENRINVIDT